MPCPQLIVGSHEDYSRTHRRPGSVRRFRVLSGVGNRCIAAITSVGHGHSEGVGDAEFPEY